MRLSANNRVWIFMALQGVTADDDADWTGRHKKHIARRRAPLEEGERVGQVLGHGSISLGNQLQLLGIRQVV